MSTLCDARRIPAMIDLRRSCVRRDTVDAFSHFAQVFVSDANVYVHVYLNKIIKSRVIQCVMAYKDVAHTIRHFRLERGREKPLRYFGEAF